MFNTNANALLNNTYQNNCVRCTYLKSRFSSNWILDVRSMKKRGVLGGVFGVTVVCATVKRYKTNVVCDQSGQYLLARRPTHTRAACNPPPLIHAYAELHVFRRIAFNFFEINFINLSSLVIIFRVAFFFILNKNYYYYFFFF